jgi:hypothetical protein
MEQMKLKIGMKLGLSFAAVLLLMVISGALSYLKLAEIGRNEDSMTDIRIPSTERIRMLQNDLSFSAAKTRQTILAGTEPARKAASQEAFDKSWEEIDKHMAALALIVPSWKFQENKDKFTGIKGLLPKIRQVQQSAMDMAANGGRDGVILAGNNYAYKGTPVVNGATRVLEELAKTSRGSDVALDG